MNHQENQGVIDQLSNFGFKFLNKVTGVAHNIVESFKETTDKIMDVVVSADENSTQLKDMSTQTSERLEEKNKCEESEEYTEIPLVSRDHYNFAKMIIEELIDRVCEKGDKMKLNEEFESNENKQDETKNKNVNFVKKYIIIFRVLMKLLTCSPAWKLFKSESESLEELVPSFELLLIMAFYIYSICSSSMYMRFNPFDLKVIRFSKKDYFI
jgi:hypothetical protein